MLELTSFDHMTTCTMKFESRDRFFWVTSFTEIITSHFLFQNVDLNFADIIKIITIFIKTFFKDSKKVKRSRNYVLKCNLYLNSSI